MDLTSALVAEAIKMGLGGLLLLAAVVYMAKRDTRMQADDRARTDGQLADLRATITVNKEDCQRREDSMAARLRQLEDQRGDLLVRSVNALETTVRVVEQLVKDDTGLHRAIKGP